MVRPTGCLGYLFVVVTSYSLLIRELLKKENCVVLKNLRNTLALPSDRLPITTIAWLKANKPGKPELLLRSLSIQRSYAYTMHLILHCYPCFLSTVRIISISMSVTSWTIEIVGFGPIYGHEYGLLVTPVWLRNPRISYQQERTIQRVP